MQTSSLVMKPYSLQPDSDPAYVPRPVEPAFRDLGRKLWRRKTLIFFTTATLLVAAAVGIQVLPTRYTAEALVMVDVRTPQLVKGGELLAQLPGDIESIQSEMQILASTTLLRRVAEELRLTENPEFNRARAEPSIGHRWLAQASEFLRRWSGRDLGGDASAPVAQDAVAMTVDELAEHVTVQQQDRSRVIKVSVRASEPNVAASIVNRLVDVYTRSQVEKKYQIAEQASAWLDDRIAGLREQTRRDEEAVEAYRREANLVRGGDMTAATQQATEITSQLSKVQDSRAEIEARVDQIERLRAARRIDTLAEVLSSPVIQNLRRQQAEVAQRAAELSQNFGARHPRVLTVQGELEDIQRSIYAEITKIVSGMRTELAVLKARQEQLSASLEAFNRRIADENFADVKLRDLAREAQASRGLFETFLARSKEIAPADTFRTPDSHVVSYAQIPQRPSFPNKPLLALIAGGVAFAVALSLALLVESWNQGFRTVEQVEAVTGLHALGLIPALRRRRASRGKLGTLVARAPASAYTESIRSLNSTVSLIAGEREQQPRVILITSAMPGEGKTSVALSLWQYKVAQGDRALLIDCDLRRPTIHRVTGDDPAPGLSDVLRGTVSFEEALRFGPTPGAYVMPAGSPVQNSPDLLASDAMQAILRRAAAEYDVVILDSAPALVVTDTQVLARLADKTIFLVHWATTKQHVVVRAVSKLVDAGADIAGVLLSKVDVKRHAQYDSAIARAYTGSAQRYYVS